MTGSAVTISKIRGWKLGDLALTAAGLRKGADTLDEHALTVINKLAGIDTDWAGEAKDRAAVDAKDRATTQQETAKRWNKAAGVLDEANQQMGLLRDKVLSLVDDPENKRKFNISDDGAVTVRDDYAKTLSGDDKDAAEQDAGRLEIGLRSLLATAEVAGQQYDWQVTNALRGEERPFTPRLPPPAPAPTTGPDSERELANKDGSGDQQWNTWKPSLRDQIQLQAAREAAKATTFVGPSVNMDNYTRLLNHFLDNTGTRAYVSVDDMMRDVPGFAATSSQLTKNTLTAAQAYMPAGYNGPVAFQSRYSGSFTPDKSSNPDWFFALGTMAFQTSGVAMPSDHGNYTVAATTSIYDYYNFDKRGHLGMLNDLNRAGWAHNFDTFGTSSTQRSTYP